MRRCPQEERPRAGCDPATSGGMDRNREGPNGSERSILVVRKMLRGPHHGVTSTLLRRAAQRPGHSWYTIARYVGGGGNCEAEILQTHSANVC